MVIKKVFTGLGVGLWNGFGGKLEPNESILNAARREVKEECNLLVNKLKHIGVVKYEVDGSGTVDMVYIFTATDFTGLEAASEEMDPVRWYEYHNIPYANMWPDSPKWYPSMLKERYFSAHIYYSSNETFRKAVVEELDSLPEPLADME